MHEIAALCRRVLVAMFLPLSPTRNGEVKAGHDLDIADLRVKFLSSALYMDMLPRSEALQAVAPLKMHAASGEREKR